MDVLSKKKFYPVIHCVDPYEQQGIHQALLNTKTAMNNGADGVFLIGHSMNHSDLIMIYEQVRKQHPDIWIGINFLDIRLSGGNSCLLHAIKRCNNLNAVWTDSTPTEHVFVPLSVQVFGGLAFKYINPNLEEEALRFACEDICKFVDVATTSGDATGVAPEVSKLQSIKKYLTGGFPIALASGVTLKNVSLFLPHVDIFIVNTSISGDKKFANSEYLVPEKVRALADKIHGYKE
jgi:hypothetical protein